MTYDSRVVGNTFQTDMLVRFSHCDPAGIVFYPHYFVMFNGLVEDWFNQGLGLNYARYITEHRLGLPIVNIVCDFVAPSKIGEIITLVLAVERLGNSSLSLSITCRHAEEVRLRAKQVLVTMDLDKQHAVPIPEDLRSLIVQFQNEKLAPATK